MRLFLREEITQTLSEISDLATIIESRFSELRDVEMPGYTHLQPAMPSSFGMWLHSWYEWALELSQNGISLLNSIDSNPLGSGAGFGSSLKIDRELVAKHLQFAKVQRSFIDVNNSRGRAEERCLRFLSDIASFLEKFACDFMLYQTREFCFLTLPDNLTTGSSIMPQKRNCDLKELLGRAAKVRSCAFEVASVIAKLPSSHH